MRGFYLFVAGIVVGLAVEAAVAQTQNRGIVGLNHVAIVVPNLNDALTYYTKTMGFPEAFRSVDDKGNVTLVYVQISKNTFIELQPSNPPSTTLASSMRVLQRCRSRSSTCIRDQNASIMAS